MAIALTNLTQSGSTTDATSFNTASVTPAANALILLAIGPVQNSGSTTPTVTGCNLTWVSIGGGEYGGAGSGRQSWLFRALGASPTAGAVTIAFGSTTQLSIVWGIDQATGVDTSGTNGSGAIVQSVAALPSSSATGQTIVLSAFGSANNVSYATFSHGSNETNTAEAGYTKLIDQAIGTPSMSVMSEYQINEVTPSATWSTSATHGGVAVEIKAGTAAVRVPRNPVVSQDTALV